MKKIIITSLLFSFAFLSFSQTNLTYSKKQQQSNLKMLKNDKKVTAEFKSVPKPIADLFLIKASQYWAMSKSSQLVVANEALKCQRAEGQISAKKYNVYSAFINGKANLKTTQSQLNSLKIDSEFDAYLSGLISEFPSNTEVPPVQSQGKWGKAIGGLLGAIAGAFATSGSVVGTFAGAGLGYTIGSNLGDALEDSISGDGVVARPDGSDCTGFPKS